MRAPLGSLCLVLHGHLPYVLNHGVFPHGESWLYEAAAETYLPLLELIGECTLLNVRPAVTLGLTPILLEQLSHDQFKTGFLAYLTERAQRAEQDEANFLVSNESDFALLAGRWKAWFEQKIEQFDSIGQDIPGEFALRLREGHIQILTSSATHAYMPLILNDEMLWAQVSAGIATSTRVLGVAPRGMWLPECGYRPTVEHWRPAVLYDNPRYRVGIEEIVADAGVTHFVVDSNLVTQSQPLGVKENGDFRNISEVEIHWDQQRGWRSPLEPVGVSSEPANPRAIAFARHPRVSEQVWSSIIGYPGSGDYLDFHRKHPESGLRYHKVTSSQTPLSDKHPYLPDATQGRVYEHAQHFCGVIKEVLSEHQERTGRQGVVTAPFDAELFGHWWFEGPRFLRDVILTLANDPEVDLMTLEEAAERHEPDKVVRMPEGSWGENGNHSVWINEKTSWIWEMEYRAEGRFLQLLHQLPWQTHPQVRRMLERAARELLLLQASDWPFVIHSKGAVDYGIRRFAGHYNRFDRMTHIAELVARGEPLGPIETVEIEEVDLHDSVFHEIDLNWWMPQ